MATSNQPVDVTIMPVDVSNNIMDTTWCDHTSESCYTTSVVLYSQ